MLDSLLDPVSKLTKDIRDASISLSREEARFLVDSYINMQKQRVRTSNQVFALTKTGEPHAVMQWLTDQNESLEHQILRALTAFSKSSDVGKWCNSIGGVGPVTTAGLMAYIDISKAPTVGHIWRFAGLDPTVTWGKGQKRPWCAALKRLCFLLGESFVKVSGKAEAVYGHIYKNRKALEIARNDAGAFAEQAAHSLATKSYSPTTEAYKAYIQGRLPDARIHMRAKRYAVKLFLSAFHEVLYFDTYHSLPPKPYVIEHLGHAHYFGVPNADLIPGLAEAQTTSRTTVKAFVHESTEFTE